MQPPKARTLTSEQATEYAEALIAEGLSGADVKAKLKSLAVMVHAIGDKDVASLLTTMASKATKPGWTPREPSSGRFRHSTDTWMCTCGHPLAFHTADKTILDGKTHQPCIIGDYTECECDCEMFRKTRPATKTDPALVADVQARKYVGKPCPDFRGLGPVIAALTRLLT